MAEYEVGWLELRSGDTTIQGFESQVRILGIIYPSKAVESLKGFNWLC